VYISEPNLKKELHAFCDAASMQEPAAPLVIVGASGSGKSALLANWLADCRAKRSKSRPAAGEQGLFVFYHAVACSRHGVYVDQLLWRLLGDLKRAFDLGREVSHLLH
jgi:Tfp pilus assembly ATPase PilU